MRAYNMIRPTEIDKNIAKSTNNLIIVESPKKAALISSLMSNYTVIATRGHVRNLPSKAGSVLPDDDFRMIWETTKDKAINEIVNHAKNANSVLLATDPDREGEAIAWHIAELLKSKGVSVPMYRIKFHSLEKKAILDAVAHQMEINSELVNAYLARLSLDYLVGFNLSPFLWRKAPGNKSAGRVQSVCLRILIDKEREIAGFVPKDYWIVHSYANIKKEDIKFELKMWHNAYTGQFFYTSQEHAEKIAKVIQNKEWVVCQVDEKARDVKPPHPFITATLQQDASNKLGFRPSKTMSLAQMLYEGVKVGSELKGLITYMRTDSVYIHKDAIDQCREVIKSRFGPQYLPGHAITYKVTSKNAQNAHEAIRPTNYALHPDQVSQYLSPDLAKLYKLIWSRSVASQMTHAIGITTTVQLISEGDILETKGHKWKFLGFKVVYNTDSDDHDITLPHFVHGEKVAIYKTEIEANQTKPPKRYSEAGIIRELEKEGIGRPSTYDKILSVLQSRGYVKRSNKTLIPEDRGWVVSSILEEYFAKYVEPKFTAQVEDKLDQIAEGTTEWKSVLKEFWDDFANHIDQNKALSPAEIQNALQKRIGLYLIKEDKCPQCDGVQQVKYSKNGGFIGCSNYPKCAWIRPLTKDQTLIYQDENESVTLRSGPYGMYACWTVSNKKLAIPNTIKEEHVTWDLIQRWIELPKDLGYDTDDNRISIRIGPFGVYIAKIPHGKGAKPEYRGISVNTNISEVTLERAIEILAQPKKVRAGKYKKAASDSDTKEADQGTSKKTNNGKRTLNKNANESAAPTAKSRTRKAIVPKENEVEAMPIKPRTRKASMLKSE